MIGIGFSGNPMRDICCEKLHQFRFSPSPKGGSMAPMQTVSIGFAPDKHKLYAWASTLALITIFYNIAEGLVSVFFGMADESMSLFGFGLDSFVEVVSGIGIWHMVRRIRSNNGENLDQFERKALRITGSAFFVLTIGL